MFEDFEIEIHCPKCDAELEVNLSQIKRQENITCPVCRKDIHLKPDETSSSTGTQTGENPFSSIRQTIDLLKKQREQI